MTDKQLLSHMISIDIKYGFYDDTHKKIITTEDKEFDIPGYQDKHSRILFPDEVEKYKVGTCWDTSLYMYYKLKIDCKKYISTVKLIYIDCMKPNFVTHTTVMYRHRTSKLWYWMEYSWEKNRGIHGGNIYFKTIWDTFINTWKSTYGSINEYNQLVDGETLLKMKKITPQIFLSVCNV